MRNIQIHTELTPEELFILKRMAEECRVREFVYRGGSRSRQEDNEEKSLVDKLLASTTDTNE